MRKRVGSHVVEEALEGVGIHFGFVVSITGLMRVEGDGGKREATHLVIGTILVLTCIPILA